jgi:hypothetical protein
VERALLPAGFHVPQASGQECPLHTISFFFLVMRAIDLPGAKDIDFILNNLVLGRGIPQVFPPIGFCGPQIEDRDLNCVGDEGLEMETTLAKDRFDTF